MTTLLQPADEIVCQARANKMIDHPFFTRMTTEPTNLTALWSFYANLSEVNDKAPSWMANLLIHSEDLKIKCLLSQILFEELGSGNPERVQSLLMGKLIEALDPWKPLHPRWDPRKPGKILAGQMADVFAGSDAVDMDFVVGSLISGEIYTEQMIFALAYVVRDQDEISKDALEWQLIHERVESGDAQTSLKFTTFVPDNGPRLDQVRAGARWKRDTLWAWLDGVYKAAYNGDVVS